MECGPKTRKNIRDELEKCGLHLRVRRTIPRKEKTNLEHIKQFRERLKDTVEKEEREEYEREIEKLKQERAKKIAENLHKNETDITGEHSNDTLTERKELIETILEKQKRIREQEDKIAELRDEQEETK